VIINSGGAGALENRGSITERPIALLLQAMQSERSTGTLQLRRGSEVANLYFLFGHLFHALVGTRNGSLQGEDAVFEALAWTEGEFVFDPKAKLPPEETIKASTHEILQEAVARGLVAPGQAGAGTQPPPPSAGPPAPSARPAEPIPVSSELYPLPLGTLVYESLKTGFVDFPKLLRSLQADHLTGYLRLTASTASGMVLLYRGSLMEALYDGGAVVSTGRTAFALTKGNVDRGDGTIDVHQLSDEVAHSIYHLLTAPPHLQGLLARFIKPAELLEHLQEERITGPVIMRSPDDLGVILLREGRMMGAYTRQDRTLTDRPDAVFALCQNPRTRIEVRAAQSLDEPPRLTLDEALSAAAASGLAGAYAAVAPPAGPAKPEAAGHAVPAEPVDWDEVVAELCAIADQAWAIAVRR